MSANETYSGEPWVQRARDAKYERAMKLLREGLPARIVSERLGIEEKKILNFAHNRGVKAVSYQGWLP